MRHLFVLFFLTGCSQTTPMRDSGPKPGLVCSDAVNGCACVQGAAVSGTCSPASLGTSAHCCGNSDQCYCAKDGTCFTMNMVCTCNARPTPDGGTPAMSCPKPMNGHCCKKNTDASQGECRCSGSACAMDEMEVTGCSGDDGNLVCAAGTNSVQTCQ